MKSQSTDSSSTNKFAIRASHLTRRFGEKAAVDGIDLAIKPGEIYGFLGPNGAGKSTTIRMLVTLLTPTSGDAWIMGHSIKDHVTRVRLRIGVALQDAALDVQQTGSEILRLQGHLYGLSSQDVAARLTQLRELVDIGDAFDQPIKTYSGGMKRRLDLACALVHNPDVLFLDEPTNGLDPISRMKIWEEVRRLNKKLGMTIFLTTQYLEEADQLADRVGIIADGKIAAEGTPQQLKKQVGQDLVIVQTSGKLDGVVDAIQNLKDVERVNVHNNELTVAAADGSKIVGPVAVVLTQAHVKLEQLTLRSPSLDDVFLEVTGNRLQREEKENKK